MAGAPRRPEFKISGNTVENFKNFELRFNDYAYQAEFRDFSKDVETIDHYVKPQIEIAALRSAMPDEALQVIRYTIDRQIPVEDKQKPWIWMDRLHAHYTGATCSSLLADRFQFWTSRQLAHESVLDWEVRVRQSATLCEYREFADELCRDKFIFGLAKEGIRTELLKTHLAADKKPKSLHDVVSEAKAMETAERANRIITDTNSTEEQVNFTSSSSVGGPPPHKKHRDMKLKRQAGTCYWCGDSKGPHPWRDRPARGKTCGRCKGLDHFARVCLEQAGGSQSRSRVFNQHRGRNQQFRTQHVNEMEMIQEPDDYDDFETFVCEVSNSPESKRKKRYFAKLSLLDGTDKADIDFQIDSGATCNTVSASALRNAFPDICLLPSRAVLRPYGNGPAIRPVGCATLVCDRQERFESLELQVVADKYMSGKPNLLSGTDAETLGILNIAPDYVCQLGKEDPPKPELLSETSKSSLYPTPLPPPGALTKDVILKVYNTNFRGLGSLQPPVSFVVDRSVTPVNMPIHRRPIAKRAKEKETLDRYVSQGILARVEEPTPWCSNTIIVEAATKFRVCLEPSRTINKAIQRLMFQMPTLAEHFPSLARARVFSVVDAKEGFLQCPLDETSSYLTTMHTSYGRYRWLRMPFGKKQCPGGVPDEDCHCSGGAGGHCLNSR